MTIETSKNRRASVRKTITNKHSTVSKKCETAAKETTFQNRNTKKRRTGAEFDTIATDNFSKLMSDTKLQI